MSKADGFVKGVTLLTAVLAASAGAAHAAAEEAAAALERPVHLPSASLAFEMAQDGVAGDLKADEGGAIAEPVEEPIAEPKKPLAFGAQGTDWFSLGVGAAFSDDAEEYNGRFMWHHFIARDFEFNLGLGGWYHDQDGDGSGRGGDANTGSVNPSIGFRWHFINEQKLTVYAETGIGLLFSGDDVPDGGTSINFTPRAGIGATFRLGDGPQRLDVGFGWHHISNASTTGSDDNPSRDSLMVYVGLVFPF